MTDLENKITIKDGAGFARDIGRSTTYSAIAPGIGMAAGFVAAWTIAINQNPDASEALVTGLFVYSGALLAGSIGCMIKSELLRRKYHPSRYLADKGE